MGYSRVSVLIAALSGMYRVVKKKAGLPGPTLIFARKQPLPIYCLVLLAFE
ncbi:MULTISPECIES: hypothetical protein [Paenibacillus]|uniref:hypothetical protein n=1 Tax=Paenibacillus TaxID=44249 RepID=UPI0022B8718A|nr:hypothetical protein [Paenibacillus caseinilyticus]MCZ8518175.1 hypothetical protein [Paenibacillus caseinilyticus]